jgi:GNAT superfamily N-acetyltransferase
VDNIASVTVRPAAIVERFELEALQWRASLMWEEDRDALIAHPDAIDLPAAQINEGRTLVAELEGTVVGFAVVLPRPDEDAELDGLFVEPSIWRAGIGRRLLRAAEGLAAAGSATFLYVVSNPRAEGFYYACDFVPVGQQSTRFGNGLVMRKPIRGPMAPSLAREIPRR